MNESERGQGAAGEPTGELAGARVPDLVIYLVTHDVRKVTVKKRRETGSGGKEKKIRVVKINPPTAATIDEPLTRTLILSPKKPGIKCTEDQILKAIAWVAENRERSANGIPTVGNEPLDFGRVDTGLQKIQRRLEKGRPKA